MKKGIFCMSFDVDLLWGRHDLNYSSFIKPLGNARKILKTILRYFKEKDIHATWAMIGHLFLESCRPTNGILHPEIKRPYYPWYSSDWFAQDPASNLKTDPLWYAKDILNILKSQKDQEVACHSFSHIIFGHPGCSRETAESEIKNCLSLAKKENIKLNSFVFPRNEIGYLDLLKKHGFKSFRGAQPDFESRPKIYQLLWLLSPTSPPTFKLHTKGGLVNIPASFYLLSARGPRSFIPSWVIINKVKRGIDQAIENHEVFHIWTHLEDFAENYKFKMKIFKNIVDYALKKRREEKLEIMTMQEIAKAYYE